MAIITVSGKQIDLNTNEIRFLDQDTGLTRIVKPQNVVLDLINNVVSFSIETRIITPTGFEIGQPLTSSYMLDIKATSILGEGFQKPFANAIFQDALKPYGIEAKQIFDSTGKLNVKQ